MADPREQALRELEEQLAVRTAAVYGREQQMAEQEAALAERTAAVYAREKQVAAKKAAVAEWAKTVSAQKTKLDTRLQRLQAQEDAAWAAWEWEVRPMPCRHALEMASAHWVAEQRGCACMCTVGSRAARVCRGSYIHGKRSWRPSRQSWRRRALRWRTRKARCGGALLSWRCVHASWTPQRRLR